MMKHLTLLCYMLVSSCSKKCGLTIMSLHTVFEDGSVDFMTLVKVQKLTLYCRM